MDSCEVCTLSPTAVLRPRACFTYALDVLDFSPLTQSSVEAIQSRRANGELQLAISAALDKQPGYDDSAEKIRRDARESIRLGGKEVWSETFLSARSHWRIPSPESVAVAGSIYHPHVDLGRADPALRGWSFEGVQSFLSRDGVIVATWTFQHSGERDYAISCLISAARRLKHVSRTAYIAHAEEVISKNGPMSRLFSEIGLAPGTTAKGEKIRSHRTIFAKEMACPSSKRCDPHRLRATHAVAGILNLSPWYQDYHPEYLERLGRKEFGYRASELYLTDKDSTVAVRSDFLEPDSALNLYMGNVLQAVEYHLGIQALLRGQLQYARSLYSLDLGQLPANDLVQKVQVSRAILSGAFESLNYSVMVLHGFTRRLLRSLDDGAELGRVLKDIERRVENVNDSVALFSSASASQLSSQLQTLSNRISLATAILTVIAVVVGAVSLIQAMT